MIYRSLPPSLIGSADAVASYFKNEHGLRGLKVEAPLDEDVGWRPTLSGTTTDHHILCIEVTSGAYTTALDGFVLDCQRLGLPVRLYIACPDEDNKPGEFEKTFRKAQARGVGLVRVNGKRCKILTQPLELSLSSVRRIDPKDFLGRYKQAMHDAETTFLNGDPVSGCSRVFVEMEDLSRRFAEKTANLSWWPGLKQKNYDRKPWGSLMTVWKDDLDYKLVKAKCPLLTPQLISTVIGLTPKRNETGPHKLTNRAKLMKRDRDLRTRFESAVQVFIELQNAGRPLRL